MMLRRMDAFGRVWGPYKDEAEAILELCPECGQPDNCGDCNHEPYTQAEAEELGALAPVVAA